MSTTQNSGTQGEIISYQKLRTFIGITGILLPLLTVFGSFLFSAGNYSWQHSISHFYYSKMHIIFVGTLCVLGGFLITYRGTAHKAGNPWENRVSNIAGVCAFGIASFPTGFDGFRPPSGGSNQYIHLLDPPNEFWGGMHFAFAGSLFLCFILFCLWFFQKPDAVYTGDLEIKWKRRKAFYKFCGWGIAVSIIMIALFSFIIKPAEGVFVYSTFIFETTSLWCFGSAWLIKGSAAWCHLPIVGKMMKPLR
ncbi:MAG TPA: hypothetical protein VKT28_11680 [Puia sp.]|nr:hypothetical protein [Puia sp.]